MQKTNQVQSMNESEPLVNKVAESDIRVFNLEQLWDGRVVEEIDISDWLFKRLVLKEKDFRQYVKAHDWGQYSDKHLAVFCSTDAIVPTWAFMLVASRAEPFAASVTLGSREEAVRAFYQHALETVDWSVYDGAPVVIKGCASKIVPQSAYLSATTKLQAHALPCLCGDARSPPNQRQKRARCR
jgi:hypothetical protein